MKLLLAPILAFSAIASSYAQYSPVSLENFLVTKESALLVGPPTLMLNTMVGEASWSPNGRYLIAQRLSLPRSPEALRELLLPTAVAAPTVTTYIVDVLSGDSRAVYESKPGGERVTVLGWMPGGSNAVLSLHDGSESRLVLTSASGVLSEFAPWGSRKAPFVNFSSSPRGDRALVVAGLESSEGRGEVVAFGYTTNGSRRISTPKSDILFNQIRWSQDGDAYIQTYRFDQIEKTMLPSWSRLSFDGAEPTGVTEPPELPGPAKGTWIEIIPDNVGLESSARSIETAWLKAMDAKPVLVSADCHWAELSPDNLRVAYVAEGALFVRSLLPIELAKFQELQALAQRQQVMQQAKQVGIAAAIFATDNDDRYPTPRDFKDALGPYLKNPEMMKNFVWTFAGGDATLIERPSQTEIGYIALPGGRAVVFADTSVRWIAN